MIADTRFCAALDRPAGTPAPIDTCHCGRAARRAYTRRTAAPGFRDYIPEGQLCDAGHYTAAFGPEGFVEPAENLPAPLEREAA